MKAAILVVDDDVALLHALPEMLGLRMPHILVETADSAPVALDRVANIDFDAIVTDIKMPGMDGLELLARIRSVRPDTPTLLITGHGEHDLAIQALRGGAFDFIQKPIDRDYFLASLSRALRMREVTRELERQRLTLERRAARLEQIVADRTHKLREANRLKDEFLAILAHELRNPLAPIRNAVELMRLRGLDDPIHETSRSTIERQVIHMARLVDDLLDVSGISRGKIELRKEAVDLAGIVHRSLETVAELFRSGGHEVSVSLPGEPLWVEADPTRLEQIVGNLLSNAAKYTEAGGSISVGAQREGGEIVLRVRDTGIGIKPKMLRYIFEPFAQAEQTLDRSRGGLGLGLTLVKQLTQMHGGKVQAASAGPGRGSEFVVRLPALAPSRRLETSSRGPSSEGAEPKSILIIEDNADSRESLRLLLQVQRHRVDVACDGNEGLAKAMQLRPQVALVDIGLPGISGYEVAERMRAAPENDRVFLVALTGYGASEDRRRATRAGFDAHLLKPVDPQALNRVLAAIPGSALPPHDPVESPGAGS